MMGQNHFRIVESKINAELKALERIFSDFEDFHLSRKAEEKENLDLRLYGSFLHDLYTCIERIFREIASTVDGEIPAGANWHSDLLNQMSINITGIRPQVIDVELREQLYEYLRFRHIFRNVYGHTLKWDKLSSLVKGFQELYGNVETAVQKFIVFLQKIPEP